MLVFQSALAYLKRQMGGTLTARNTQMTLVPIPLSHIGKSDQWAELPEMLVQSVTQLLQLDLPG